MDWILDRLPTFISGGVAFQLYQIIKDWVQKRDKARFKIDDEATVCLRDPIEHEEQPTWHEIPKKLAEQFGFEEARKLGPEETLKVPVFETKSQQNSHYFSLDIHNVGRRGKADNCQAELTYISPHNANKRSLGRGKFCCWEDNWNFSEINSQLYSAEKADSIDIRPGGRARLAFVLKPNGLDLYPHPDAERIRNMSIREYSDLFPTKVGVTVTADNAPAQSRTFHIVFRNDGFYIYTTVRLLKNRFLRHIYGPIWRQVIRPLRLKFGF